MSILSYEFMQNAILAAFLCSIACGIIGSFVILNRLSYLAGAAAHAAYGGIGVAFFSGAPVLPCTMTFSLLSSLLMAKTMIKGGDIAPDRTSDTAMGILWAGGMAVGIILIDMSDGYAGDLMGYLFGSILAVPGESIVLMAVLDLTLLLLIRYYGQGLAAITIDPEFARSRGLNVKGYFYLLVGMTAIAVVMLLQIVGLILVIALLTIPPCMGKNMTKSLPAMMAASALLCFAFCLGGLALATLLDVTPGAVIIAVAAIAYGIQHVFSARL